MATFSTSARNSNCDAFADRLDGGSLIAYDGTPPATAQDALSGNTALATITIPTPATDAAGTGGAGVAQKSGTWSTTVSVTGVMTFIRLFDSGANCLAQLLVAELTVSNPSLVATQTFTVSTADFVSPASS